ncbi:hypothetical protein [Billgrantia montanilacus]|uniref:Uncharacterized protein n=1 Tax=Billgrantia montanilacus TaxID=2282305 RepID=A0A368TUH8_9GAMM|nr:hypothetical protein [Halomonas montanilacus]RCV88344.1 hypothetical protein DU505_13700 [Halomonas montanilacus]
MSDEPLPPIKIKADCLPRDFVHRLNKMVASLGSYTPRYEKDFMGESGFDILNLEYTGNTQYKDFIVQFICVPNDAEYVSFEVRASRWVPNDPPTYDEYVKVASEHGKRILSEYNKAHSSRRRLSIPSKEKLEPKLSPMCDALFSRFVNLANKQALHPLDWNRFYEFVTYCKNRRKYSGEDIARLLQKEGFSAQYSEYIGSVYRHLCEFKRYF